MRTFVYLLLLTMFVSASVTCVSASTECERWYVAYRQDLAHSRNLQRIAAAKRRAKRKLATYTKPATPAKAVHHGPRMQHTQLMHRIDLACGVLPEGDADQPVISEEIPETFNPELPMDTIDLLPDTPTGLIAEEAPPTFPGSDTPSDQGGPGFPGFPGIPGGPGYFPTGGSHPPPPNTPPPNSPPPNSPPLKSPPPPPAVPEPSSFVLLFTGAAAGLARRRYAA